MQSRKHLGIDRRSIKRFLVRAAAGLTELVGATSLAHRISETDDSELVRRSGLFDANFYRSRYPDVAADGADPLVHFLAIGGQEGRLPCPLFRSDWYLETYPEVRNSRLNPLVHYLRCGARDGYNPNRWFDSSWYLQANPDVSRLSMNPLSHYVKQGAKKLRAPSPLFDVKWYTKKYPESLLNGDTALGYYLAHHDGQSVPSDFEYFEWVKQFDSFNDAVRVELTEACQKLNRRPRISVVMPVFNTDPVWLRRAIDSVREQVYSDWELCISDDASTDPRMREILQEYAAADSRIKVVFRTKNGHISANSNTALELASGEFVALLDCDDELPPAALYWVADTVNRIPDVCLIYSDEDKIDEDGRRFQPYFKPDWNESLMLSQNMFSHLGVFRRDLVHKVGGFREGFEGSQDHDLVLRCAARVKTNQIAHIPRVLYHWRAIKGSTAAPEGVSAKPYATSAGICAIEHFLSQKNIAATVEPAMQQFYQIRYKELAHVPRIVGASSQDRFGDLIAETDEFLCVMRDGMKPKSTQSLTELLSRFAIPEVCMVAPKTLVQGQFHPIDLCLPSDEIADRITLPACDGGYIGRALLEQDVSCVAPYLVIIRTSELPPDQSVFQFFQRSAFAKFCSGLRASNKRILWVPTSIYEYDGVSIYGSGEINAQPTIVDDPFYNKNLSVSKLFCGLAFPPRLDGSFS